MKQFIRNGWLVVILCVGFAVGGCATYYKVTDPHPARSTTPNILLTPGVAR